MSLEDFRTTLMSLDLSNRPDEVEFRDRMVVLLDSTPRCFYRDSFPAHFTGSALVVNADGSKALLHHHRKLDKWLQFGGHCDGDEDILRVAQREALEESGIQDLIVASTRPFDLDIHEIPARGDEPAHWHYDVRFMFIAPEGAQEIVSEESCELKWMTPEEALDLERSAGLKRLIRKWQTLRERRLHS